MISAKDAYKRAAENRSEAKEELLANLEEEIELVTEEGDMSITYDVSGYDEKIFEDVMTELRKEGYVVGYDADNGELTISWDHLELEA